MEKSEPPKEDPKEQVKQEPDLPNSEQSKQEPLKTSKRTTSKPAGRPKPKKKPNKKVATSSKVVIQANYPRHSLKRALRVPKAILEQHAGRACTYNEAAGFLGFKLNGELRSEISSGIKYGLLDRPSEGKIQVSDLARKIFRPQQPTDVIAGLREAILKAPDISDIYKHYRGENLPDFQFFDNTLADTFKIPQSEISKFRKIFIESLQEAELLEEHQGKWRVLDVSSEKTSAINSETIKKLGKSVSVSADDSCFVIMPFAPPLGNHYQLIFEPAIEKAGLKAVRADADIFATGKIMDQVWRGISAAKVLVAELTSRNPNVFYELGLAHALKKPVVLISSNENDVPFDVRHIRVIYYDINDPFWGDKLMAKVSENILSAIKNPEEAIFEGANDFY